MPCKCQAFIAHNLFISLHIKLVMFVAAFGVPASERAIREADNDTKRMNDCSRLFVSICEFHFTLLSTRFPIELKHPTAAK